MLTAEAPAKINRELRVGRLRPDGYHEISSRMTSIDLADRIRVEAADGLELRCDDPAVPTGDDNLVVRAARLLARAGGLEPRARLTLEKRVPMGGGLGGGSADAAITLLLLARFWRLGLGRERLASVAAELGSDVPFFLDGGEADVSGRGEVVTPLEDGDGPATDLLLVVPPFAISTAGVYRAYAGRGRLPERLDLASPGHERFLGPNDLAPAVLLMEPGMEAYLSSAAALTDDWAISGSGATVVLHGAGRDAAARLAARHPEARVISCRTLSRAEYAARTGATGGVA
jgi:4-diphosphocytidyl-2-C-methyl-D-erythritol kinase